MSFRSLLRRTLIEAAVATGGDVRSRRRLLEGMRSRHTHDLRVLLLHGTPPEHATALRRHLEWLAGQFTLVDFATFKRLWADPQPPADGRPAVLITFDDGLESQAEIAAPLLEEFGARGVFFVVPEFSELPAAAADDFYVRVLEGPAGQPRRPMTPQRVRELADRGHTIGSHTLSHVRLSQVPPADLDRQIVAATETLQAWTGRPVETFAWTYSNDAINPAAYQLACRHHAWCFTPCPGLVDPAVDSPQLIWRTNVEAWWSRSEWRFLCSGLGDRLWRQRRDALHRLLLG